MTTSERFEAINRAETKDFLVTPLLPPQKNQDAHRLHSLDLLRGVIMIFMVLDHVAESSKFHPHAEWWIGGDDFSRYNSTAIAYTAFFTRYVTHLAAPGFAWLMGFGMLTFYASRRRLYWTRTRIVGHLIIRGLILLLIDQIIFTGLFAALLGGSNCTPSTEDFICPGGPADSKGHVSSNVLFALGWNMILLSPLLCLDFLISGETYNISLDIPILGNSNPPVTFSLSCILMLGAAIGCGMITETLIPAQSHATDIYSVTLRMILIPGRSHWYINMYPVVPWATLTFFGMAMARFFLDNSPVQQDERILLHPQKKGGTIFHFACLELSITFLIFFILIRVFNHFGNINPSSNENVYPVLKFLYVTKYPPSLAYISYTMCVNLLLIFIFHVSKLHTYQIGKFILVFGKSALFFYIAQAILAW